MRWRHPVRGLLTPDQFLAVSEDIGVIGPLGDWVLRQACHQAKRWQSIDPARAFSVAVNLSAPEMFSADLVSRVRSALDESGLAGTLLVLEITEGIIMADTEQATGQLADLRKLGVRIAIDDFGTGYSSLAYARELPVDILKIDRSFIGPLDVDHQALTLVRAIVGIARALDLDVIVEGVNGSPTRASWRPRLSRGPRLLLRPPDQSLRPRRSPDPLACRCHRPVGLRLCHHRSQETVNRSAESRC